MELNKNTELDVTIENLGLNGEGVARPEGKTVFVRGALVGEKVRARIVFARPSFCHAIVIKRHNDSAQRIAPACPHFLKCGGCQLQHLAYDEQLRFKKQLVADTLERIGKLRVSVNDTVASPLTYRYRNKMSLPVRADKYGNAVIGMFAENSHRVIACEDCLLQPAWNKTLIALTKQFLQTSGYTAYDEEKEKGDVRHLVAREVEGCLYVTLVSSRKIELTEFDSLLQANFSRYVLYSNVNTGRANTILGIKWKRISEADPPQRVEGLLTEIHPAGFFQVNDGIRRRLYADAVRAVQDAECPIVIDAYAGAGLMTAAFAQFAQEVVGIEINRQATDTARELIASNNIANMSAVLGDVKDELPPLLDKYKDEKVALVLDPPRAGCDRGVLETILQVLPHTIVYVSCNPATLARDLEILSASYEVESVTPYDMFPQTKNVETLVCLARKA